MSPRIILPACLLAALLLAGCGAPADAFASSVPVAITIVDAETGAPVRAAVYADDQQVALEVSAYTLQLVADGQPHELRVEAPGYQIWSIKIAGELKPGRRISGPVKLRRLSPGGRLL